MVLNKLDQLYDEMFKDVSEQLLLNGYSQQDIDDLCIFKTKVGMHFPKTDGNGIVFYGRATNGWDEYDESDNNKIENILWTQTRRPFFNLIYWVAWAFYGNDYHNSVVWSNIYKIAPNGGNPSTSLQIAQHNFIVEIIRKEINILSPAVVVLITGNTVGAHWKSPFWEAFPYLKLIDSRQWGREKECIASLYSDGVINVILTDRPERRPIEDHYNAIIDLIKSHNLDKGICPLL